MWECVQGVYCPGRLDFTINMCMKYEEHCYVTAYNPFFSACYFLFSLEWLWAIDWKLCADIVKCFAIGFTSTKCLEISIWTWRMCISGVAITGQWCGLERKANISQAKLLARVFICSDNSPFISWLDGSSVNPHKILCCGFDVAFVALWCDYYCGCS